jgi:hypothetical protein
MKKVILSLLTVVYMVSASGLPMQIHYCMGEKVGFEFYHGVNEKCAKCGMQEKKGCCSDEQRFFKLSLDHKMAGSVECPSPAFKLLASSNLIIPDLSFQNITIPKYSSASPPGPAGLTMCRYYCIYRL